VTDTGTYVALWVSVAINVVLAVTAIVQVILSRQAAERTLQSAMQSTRDASRLAAAKESRDALDQQLLRCEETLAGIGGLSAIPVALRDRNAGPAEGWKPSVVAALGDFVPAPASEGTDLLRTLMDHAPVLGINGWVSFPVLKAYLDSLADITMLRAEVEASDDSYLARHRIADRIQEIVQDAVMARAVVSSGRGLVHTEYRRLIGDHTTPLGISSMLLWNGDQWVFRPDIAERFGLGSHEAAEPAEPPEPSTKESV
jgi:hypothetical protein